MRRRLTSSPRNFCDALSTMRHRLRTSPLRMLVTGASGQLARSLAGLDESEPGLSVAVRGRPKLDLENPGIIATLIDHIRPDIVVNAAAYTAVDAAEADSAGSGAAAPAAAGLPLIHISTDYVFGGGQTRPYREDDAPEPRTAYGRSKLAGETAIAATNPDHVILRTAWLYSPHGSNFVKTMLRLAGERDTIRVGDDQFGNPPYAPDLAAAIYVIAGRMLDAPDDPALRGVFHLAGPDSATWCDFAREIMLVSAELGGPAAEITPIGSSEYPTPPERPRHSLIDSA